MIAAALLLASHLATRPPARVPMVHITPAVVRLAKGFLDLPMGTERYLEVDGRRCVFVVEPHWHPMNFVGGPRGWHKGVSVYELR